MNFVCIIIDLMNAATKIQASFRGHMARKQAEKGKTEGEIAKEMEKLQSKVKNNKKFFNYFILVYDDDDVRLFV